MSRVLPQIEIPVINRRRKDDIRLRVLKDVFGGLAVVNDVYRSCAVADTGIEVGIVNDEKDRFMKHMGQSNSVMRPTQMRYNAIAPMEKNVNALDTRPNLHAINIVWNGYAMLF